MDIYLEAVVDAQEGPGVLDVSRPAHVHRLVERYSRE